MTILLRLIFYALIAVAIMAAVYHWRARAQAPVLTGYATVVDGDSLEMGDVKIRLFGVDAPELSQTCKDAKGESYRCGSLAASLLEEEIGGRAVMCFPQDSDHYGRVIATCEVNGHDLGDVMVRRGMAVAEHSARYMDAEVEARRAKRGIWAGSFQMPEDWRNGGSQH